MTLLFDAPVTSVVSTATVPEPLAVQADRFGDVIDDGAVVVDLRDEDTRRTDGALLGALALDLTEALDLLTPGHRGALRSASPQAQWLLVTADGYDAEFLAWHLQARGVTGARFVFGGHRALTAAGVSGTVAEEAHAFFG